MAERIVIIQGHPDPAGGHFCHALADAYAEGAGQAGHEVHRLDVAALDVPMLRTKSEFETGHPGPAIVEAQQAIGRARHLVIVYPLWLGTMPALLKAFFEQSFRPGFAFEYASGGRWRKNLGGRSARVVVTMGMPALAYRWYFRAHSLKSLERNILGFCGIGPIRETLIGSVETCGDDKRKRWLERLAALGRRAA